MLAHSCIILIEGGGEGRRGGGGSKKRRFFFSNLGKGRREKRFKLFFIQWLSKICRRVAINGKEGRERIIIMIIIMLCYFIIVLLELCCV